MVEGRGSSVMTGRRHHASHGADCRCGRSHVTFRQAEVLALIAVGLTINEAALRLGIALTTAEDHLRSMRRRAQARTTLELLARAFAAGVFVPGSWPPRLSGQLCIQGVLPTATELAEADTVTAG
jgi:DNA-binding CsgD family transcriptional regulator